MWVEGIMYGAKTRKPWIPPYNIEIFPLIDVRNLYWYGICLDGIAGTPSMSTKVCDWSKVCVISDKAHPFNFLHSYWWTVSVAAKQCTFKQVPTHLIMITEVFIWVWSFVILTHILRSERNRACLECHATCYQIAKSNDLDIC